MSSSFTKNDYIDDIKLQLTGGLIDLEVDDETIGKFVDKALIELRRYIDETKLITVPFAKCIDLSGWDETVSAVVKVYRARGISGDTTEGYTTSEVDPMYAQTWMAFSNGGTGYNLQAYMMNYMSYNTLLQLRNTTTTDMAFKEVKGGSVKKEVVDPETGKVEMKTVQKHELYINAANINCDAVTIEYVPVYKDPAEITSDYWIDILKRLSLALVKIGLGRVRTRYTQSNALWTQDGETMLAEGNEELKELRETLRTNSAYFYPID